MFDNSMFVFVSHQQPLMGKWFRTTSPMAAKPLALLCLFLLHVVEWLEQGTLQRIVMVVTHSDTNEVIERWTFSVEADKPPEDG